MDKCNHLPKTDNHLPTQAPEIYLWTASLWIYVGPIANYMKEEASRAVLNEECTIYSIAG